MLDYEANKLQHCLNWMLSQSKCQNLMAEIGSTTCLVLKVSFRSLTNITVFMKKGVITVHVTMLA